MVPQFKCRYKVGNLPPVKIIVPRNLQESLGFDENNYSNVVLRIGIGNNYGKEYGLLYRNMKVRTLRRLGVQNNSVKDIKLTLLQ